MEIIKFLRDIDKSIIHKTNIEVLSDIKLLANKELKQIGRGTTRTVYQIDNSKVLKIPHTVKDISYNKTEVKLSQCLGYQYCTEIYAASTLGMWLIAEKVNPTNQFELKKWFEKNIGYSSNTTSISELISNITSSDHRKLYKKSNWFKGLIDRINECNVDPIDFEANNWGFRIGQVEPVLLDCTYQTDIGLNETHNIKLLPLLF